MREKRFLARFAWILAGVLAATGTAAGQTITEFATPTACSPDQLCLRERFRIGVTWTRPDGSSGVGHPVNLTADSGYFWFLEPGNVELAVKTLDGCRVNGHYWFFAGGLTNLEVVATVTDTMTGETKEYSNPQGTAFLPIADTTSSSGCTAGAEGLPNPEEPPEALPFAVPTAARLDATPGCATSDAVLCLDERFQVEATWRTASGRTGPAHAVGLTPESGYFWFFDPANVELVVKALDACGIGRGEWFFAAGMTTVGVELKVTDTTNGEVKTYSNPPGAAFLPVQDTSSFLYCGGQSASAALHAFNGNDGASPRGVLIRGADGNFYGTTYSGGAADRGTVFRIDASGELTTLHSFAGPDGASPEAGLIQAADGSFYGTTAEGGPGGCDHGRGGCGTLFRLEQTGDLTTLYSFSGPDGEYPLGDLVQATDGGLYGTSYFGGSAASGTIFRIDGSGTLTTVHSFPGPDGGAPESGLVQGTDGSFYGTTSRGGSQELGSVFRVGADGVLTTLHDFTHIDGAQPEGRLVQAEDGSFYGTTSYGGAGGLGTVFRIETSGRLTTIHAFSRAVGSFSAAGGSYPRAGLIQSSDGNLYGTTEHGGTRHCSDSNFDRRLLGCGTVFKIDASGVLTTLHSFSGPDGAFPGAALVLGDDGYLYGTTSGGGSGQGVVFRIPR